MSGNGQLGPLDVQVLKKDELLERQSGLAPIQAIDFLRNESIKFCFKYFVELVKNTNFSAKTSIKIATEFVSQSLEPIYSQIDPVKLAEAYRSTKIAYDYGTRLATSNVKSDAIDILVRAYPSHSFVIDRDEAKSLFNHVLHLNEQDETLKYFFNSVKIKLRENLRNDTTTICGFVEKKEGKNDK
jgi:hypothetical protein